MARCQFAPGRSLTALVPGVLVRVVQTVVVAVAYVYSGYAVAVVAREQVAEARAALRLAVLGRLVGPVAAVVVAVAVPRGRYAPVVRAPEAVGRARALRTMYRVLVAVVAAIVVAVAQPVRFHAYVRPLALEMVGRARHVLRAPVVRLVRRGVVLAVVHAVAHLRQNTVGRSTRTSVYAVFARSIVNPNFAGFSKSTDGARPVLRALLLAFLFFFIKLNN